MKSKLYILLLTFFMLYSNRSAAQLSFEIGGVVTDKTTGQPLESVNIILYNAQNHVIVKKGISGHDGTYRFNGLAGGSYYLQLSFVGMETHKSKNLSLSPAQPAINMNFTMSNSRALKEVEISAKKMIYSNSIDRKVYHVDQDLMSKTSSVSEVLQNVPLVQVDIDGNVSLRNSAVTILINGKVSPLMGKNAAAALQQLPASSIERIEVVTSPSAKYKPDGTGGIINIVLKKNTKRGLNGNLTANAGNDDRYNGSTFLNYNPGKINVFGSYSIKQDDRLRATHNDRGETDSKTAQLTYFQDRLEAKSRPFSNIATLGFEYNPDSSNSLGLSGNYYFRNMHKDDLTLKRTMDNGRNLMADYDRVRKNYEYEREAGAAFFYEHAFKKEDHKLRAEFNISHQPEVEDNHFTNIYRIPSTANQLNNTLIKQISDSKEASLSYENPLSDDTKLEAGYDGQFNKQDLDFYVANFDPAKQTFITDVTKTNRFIYLENVHAFYGTLKHEMKSFGVMLGLRGELSDITSKLVNTGQHIPNKYFKIYPTAHFSYKLNKNKELQLSYSRRVHRPEGDDLNPFAEYMDPQNIRVGNPYLLPEIIHSAEIGYQWKNNILNVLPGIYYRYTYNRFTSITTPGADGVLITSQQNLANDQAFGVDVVFSASLKDKVNINFTPNLFYNQIDATNLGYNHKKSTITWSLNFNTSYSVSKNLALQINSNYKSARLTPQGKTLPSFVLNAGARQDFFNHKASFYVTVSDVFRSQRQEYELASPLLTQHILTKSNSRIGYMGLSYNFGSMKKKKDLQFDNSL